MSSENNLAAARSFLGEIDAAPSVLAFTHAPAKEVRIGNGTLTTIGSDLKTWNCRTPLLVTDKGIRHAGHADRLLTHLRLEGLNPVLFDQVHENPTTDDVAACLATATKGKIDAIIGLGGGSSMDTAKGCNFLFTNGGKMEDYHGIGLAKNDMLPFIAIPTTSGTGSECQSFALIADAITHQKMACGDKKSAARLAVLDPELTLTQPKSVTAHTGIDALVHAIETAVTTKRTPTSILYSKLAFQLIDSTFQTTLLNGSDLPSRARMQLGAAYAGTAIEASMLGAAHSCANPLSALFGTIHGVAVGVMIPHVVHFNRRDKDAHRTYTSLHPQLESRLYEHLSAANVPKTLRQLGVTDNNIPTLAALASQQWTAQFNPISLSLADFTEIYKAAL